LLVFLSPGMASECFTHSTVTSAAQHLTLRAKGIPKFNRQPSGEQKAKPVARWPTAGTEIRPIPCHLIDRTCRIGSVREVGLELRLELELPRGQRRSAPA
jgi:hypothetical protein